MNIFILCTGRCGSTTFIQACQHIRNYSSAHESRTSLLGKNRFAYPSSHIEADNRLTWLLGRLDASFGNNAFYVHLKRDVNAVARSFVARYDRGIIKAYRNEGIMMGLSDDVEPFEVALDYCETVDANIKMFLKGKNNAMIFELERAEEDFPRFCKLIDADVDVPSALNEFKILYNSTASNKSE